MAAFWVFKSYVFWIALHTSVAHLAQHGEESYWYCCLDILVLNKIHALSRVLHLSKGEMGLLSYCFHLWSVNLRVIHGRPVVHHTFGVTEVTYP